VRPQARSHTETPGDGGDKRTITEKDGKQETIENPKRLIYEKLVVPAIEAIQTIKTADDKRDEEIAALKAANDNLRADDEKQLAALKAGNDNLRAEFEAYKKSHP
jgi:hypothetical protein